MRPESNDVLADNPATRGLFGARPRWLAPAVDDALSVAARGVTLLRRQATRVIALAHAAWRRLVSFVTARVRRRVRWAGVWQDVRPPLSCEPAMAIAGARIRTLGRATSNTMRRRAGCHVRKLHGWRLFAGEVIANPRFVGAACPSSRHLADAMAEQVDACGNGLVVELGGGTGKITRALLRQGVPPAELVTIERSPVLAAHLRRQFPHLRVIEGDATRLDTLLGEDAENVRAVVSGLPLRSLPPAVVDGIMRHVRKLLRPGGVFVQFTYDLRNAPLRDDPEFVHDNTRIVWKNIPPARVDSYIRRQPGDVAVLANLRPAQANGRAATPAPAE